jgi:hypothetical protein
VPFSLDHLIRKLSKSRNAARCHLLGLAEADRVATC